MASFDPSNQNLIKVTKEAFLFFKENIKSIVLSVILFLLLGFIYSNFITPTYNVQATLTSNEEVGQARTLSVASLLSSQDDYKGLNRLFSTMTSQAAADQMWEMGHHHEVFFSFYDPESEKYIRNNRIWDYIGSFVLGYDINRFLGPSDIKNFVNNRLDLSEDWKYSENFTLTIETSNPEIFIPFLQSLIEVSDSIVKQEKLSYAERRIDYLKEELSKAKDRDVTKTLSESIKSSYLNISLLSNDLPYAFRWIEKPRSSIYPASPNLRFIYIFFMFLGFSFICIYLYVRKNFF